MENGKKFRVKQREEKMEELEKVIEKQTIVIETLKNSSKSGVRGEEVILVSDNGSQLTSMKFLKEFAILGMKQIFTSYNNPKGISSTERYFRTYKEEVAWILDDPSYEELVERTKDFERFYNEEYSHSALGYKNPK